MTELTQLVERARKESGFLLYQHAFGRGDLNDWSNSGCYVRAVENIKKPEGSFSDNFAVYIADYPIRYGGFGLDNLLYNHRLKPAIVVHGQLLGRREIPTQVKKRGLAGLFSRKEAGKKITAYDKIQKVSDVTNIQKDKDAYIIRLTIHADIRDDVGRECSLGYFSVVSDKALIEEAVDYLKKNPQDYYNLVRGVLPGNKFPKTNKGILDRTKIPDEIAFLDLAKIDKTESQRLSSFAIHCVDVPAHFRKCGEVVKR